MDLRTDPLFRGTGHRLSNLCFGFVLRGAGCGSWSWMGCWLRFNLSSDANRLDQLLRITRFLFGLLRIGGIMRDLYRSYLGSASSRINHLFGGGKAAAAKQLILRLVSRTFPGFPKSDNKAFFPQILYPVPWCDPCVLLPCQVSLPSVVPDMSTISNCWIPPSSSLRCANCPCSQQH